MIIWVLTGFLIDFGWILGGFLSSGVRSWAYFLFFPRSGFRLVRWPLPLGRWPHSGDNVSCVFSFSRIKLADLGPEPAQHVT